jgi:4-amino-4-deoxy-L-arabinose transferase-like glycosyltransferase
MVNGTGETSQASRSVQWNRWDWIILASVTTLGAALRLYQLGELPPGFQFDEAFNAIDAKQVLAGHTPLFLPANGGREALYTYWQAVLGGLFGVNVYTLRLASAIVGILTIPACYLLLRGLLRRNSRTIAAFTSLTLAISLWHIHFSRYGIRVIMMPLILSGAMGLFWLGGHAATRRWRLTAYVGSGILVGLTPWTHPSGRLVPFILLFYVGWMLWRRPSIRSWKPDGIVSGLVITGLTAFLVFLPLGFEFLRNPDFFFGHASEVSIFAERVSGGNPWAHLLDNVLHVAGMFSFFGDQEWAHNLAGRPVFDLLMAAVFSGGIFIWIWRLRRRDDPDFDALSLLAIWTLVMLLPSVLSEAAPNYSRTMPSLPATFVAAGLGLTWLVTYQWPLRWLGPIAAAVILLFSTGSTIYDYFVRFAQSPEVYYLYDADKLDALDYLAQYADEDAVYISQLWGEKHSTVYLLRGRLGIESIDTSDTIVLPPAGKDAVYGFPAEQHDRAEALARYWPEATVEPVLDHFGNSLITVVHVPASAMTGWPADAQPTNELGPEHEAHFFEAPTLLGMQVLTTAANSTSSGAATAIHSVTSRPLST